MLSKKALCQTITKWLQTVLYVVVDMQLEAKTFSSNAVTYVGLSLLRFQVLNI